MLLNEKFIQYNTLALENIAKRVTSAMIVGYVRKDGSNIYNSAALCENGKVINTYDKILLPTYDVFDEKRYFSPGGDLSPWPLEINGQKINLGIQICEDLWDDDYDIKVSSLQKKNGADFLINISAISTAFKAAPLKRLSETIHKFNPFFVVLSSLILETNVSSFPAASTGNEYPPSVLSSITLQPSKLSRAFFTSSNEKGFSN